MYREHGYHQQLMILRIPLKLMKIVSRKVLRGIVLVGMLQHVLIVYLIMF